MKKFLLASETKAFLKRNTNLLQRRGIQLFTATSGAEALTLHDECKFDLILTDLELEDMDGFTLCARIRKGDIASAVPVIITCHKTPGNLDKLAQSGASAMLIKPIDPFELVEAIEKFTGLKMIRHKRVELDVKVTIRANGAELSCDSYDISNTGILLVTGLDLALGARISCQFTMPGLCQVEADGEVIRSMSTLKRKSLYGIKFINLALRYRKAIDEYVNLIANSGAGT
jgi:CheY-like chemotaxis protein